MSATTVTGSTSIVPFAEEHLDAAGALLAARRREQRRVAPGLDPRYRIHRAIA
ncbi:hypothetical protein [Gaiella sp.]|jgi:hypothetical protein|uniref:hypothetical protein n=1 Tax=Gaiella sp. TaxID=2663207 RepID=UPI002E2FAD7F|nr:hypothetical protein [Gaiella sp.]HEX5585582.1 hypothetical protein [Gaiella sp.]